MSWPPNTFEAKIKDLSLPQLVRLMEYQNMYHLAQTMRRSLGSAVEASMVDEQKLAQFGLNTPVVPTTRRIAEKPRQFYGKEKSDYDYFNHETNKMDSGHVNLANMQLKAPPPILFHQCPQIKTLALKNNQIKELPSQLFLNLPYLAWFDIRDNKLTTLPAFPMEHCELRVILLDNNELTELPYTLYKATNLQSMTLRGNKIMDPPEHILVNGVKAVQNYLFQRVTVPDFNISGSNSKYPETDDDEFADKASRVQDYLSEYQQMVVNTEAQECPTTKVSYLTKSNNKTLKKIAASCPRENKEMTNMKYTWDLWKHIPYRGYSKENIYDKAVEDLRRSIEEKKASTTDSLIQKLKDHSTLQKWRDEARRLQMQRQNEDRETRFRKQQ